jgi:hypothetical protein
LGVFIVHKVQDIWRSIVSTLRDLNVPK